MLFTSSGEVANGSTHLGSLETNNRTVWWGEAWRVFRAHPAGGTGAFTFEIARKRVRDNARAVGLAEGLAIGKEEAVAQFQPSIGAALEALSAVRALEADATERVEIASVSLRDTHRAAVTFFMMALAVILVDGFYFAHYQQLPNLRIKDFVQKSFHIGPFVPLLSEL